MYAQAQPSSHADLVVEDAPWSLPYAQTESLGRARFSAVVTLSLAVLGRCAPVSSADCLPSALTFAVLLCDATEPEHSCSSVLPVPFAFSKIGVVTGLVTMAIVAYANELTSRLLTRAAAYSGKTSYEELAQWAGGHRWKVRHLISCSVLHVRACLARGGQTLNACCQCRSVVPAVRQ